LPETEANKRKWRQEALIEDVDFIEMLNEQADDH